MAEKTAISPHSRLVNNPRYLLTKGSRPKTRDFFISLVKAL